MSKAKPPPSTDAVAAPAAADQKTLRSNPEIDAKIDAYIKENPKYWSYIQELPRERLERMQVLSEVQKLDRQQRVRDNVLKQLERNPALKNAYDTLVANVPEQFREDALVQIASRARRTIARTQSLAQNA